MKREIYTLPEGCRFPIEKEQQIGTYGTRYLTYLEHHQPTLLFSMKLLGMLGTYLKYKDEEAEDKFKSHLSAITEKEGITDHLEAMKPRVYEKKLKEAERQAWALTEEEMRWMKD